ncbi:hypothetical protein Tco_1154749 [Tanacetum coccineum]
MLKKLGLEDSKPIKTPMSSETKLTKNDEEESMDSTKYRVMIGSLLYLTTISLDILFSKQMALAISTTEVGYVSTGKTCLLAL